MAWDEVFGSEEDVIAVRFLLKSRSAEGAGYWIRRAAMIAVLAALPALAYAVTANLTLHVTGTSSVPGPANGAGFTQLIISEDFSQPFYATRSNWLDCAGATSPLWYRAWIGFGIDSPCSAYSQEIDSQTGQPALRIHYQDSYYTGGLNLATQGPLQTVDNNGNGNRHIPPHAYFEVVARYENFNTFIQWDIWSMANGSNVEWDGVEAWGGGIDAGATMHNNDVPPDGWIDGLWSGDQACCTSFDYSQYHKWAWRVTSDGATNGFWCSYLDDVLVAPCRSWIPQASQLAANFTQIAQFLFGRHCRNTAPATCSAGLSGYQGNMWVKSIKVYSCAGLNSGAKCYSSSFNPPQS
jgi:hypothetical protein